MDSLSTYLLPTAQKVAIVVSLSSNGCQVETINDGEVRTETVRVAPIMDGHIFTGQLVLLDDDLPGSYVLTNELSTSYHIEQKRFFTKRELTAYLAALKKKEKGSLWARANKKLNSPIQRVGVIFLIVGLVTLIIGLVQAINYTGRFGSLMTEWLNAFMIEQRVVRRYPSLVWGTYLTLIGLMFSFLYDRTLGPLFRWVWRGKQ